MITSQQPVVLTSSSIDSSDEDVVEANVSIVDAMHAALLRTEEMSPVAVRSYYVDFYLTQALEGGFAQYVFTAVDRSETDTLIREGMAGMGADAHLDLFNRAVEAFDGLSEADEEHYLDGGLDDSEDTPDGVLRMEELDGEFEELLESENITALNAAWLRAVARSACSEAASVSPPSRGTSIARVCPRATRSPSDGKLPVARTRPAAGATSSAAPSAEGRIVAGARTDSRSAR
ncbi:MAG: hypothetical protein ACLGIS_02560, partial [Actinomycetes bacterium]